MKLPHKALLIGLGITALVYGGLRAVSHSVVGSKPESAAPARLGPRATADRDHAVVRNRMKRMRRLTSKEAEAFLRTTVIPRVDFEDVSLSEVLQILNDKIAEQTAEGEARPRILMDDKFMAWASERSAEWDRERQRLVASGSAVPVEDHWPTGLPRIRELRLVNVPANVLLNYVGDSLNMRYWIYEGDVYLSGFEAVHSQMRFFYEEVFDRIEIEDVRLDALATRLQELVDQHEYRGHKVAIPVVMSPKGHEALKKGEVSLPTIHLKLRHTTLYAALQKLEETSGGVMGPEGMALKYDPFKEGSMNPFDTESKGAWFYVSIDEDWATAEPEPEVDDRPADPQPTLDEILGE